MARVDSIGVLASRMQLSGIRDLNISCIPFAKLENGLIVVAQSQFTYGPGGAEGDPASIAEGARRALSPAVLGRVSDGHRQTFLGRLVEALRPYEVETDVETLSALPFDFVPDGELRDFLEAL